MKLNEIKNVNVVYHGTDAEIGAFDINKLGDNGNDQYGPGIYLVDDRWFAETYGENVYTIELLNPNFIKHSDSLNEEELAKFIMASDREYITNLFENYGYETVPEDDNDLYSEITHIVSNSLSHDTKQQTFLEIWGQSMYNFDKIPFMNLMVKFGYDGMEVDWGDYKVYALYNPRKIKIISKEKHNAN